MQMSSSSPFQASIRHAIGPTGSPGMPSANPSTAPLQAQMLTMVVMALIKLIKAQAGPPQAPSTPSAPSTPPTPTPTPTTAAGLALAPTAVPIQAPLVGPMPVVPSPVSTGRPPGDTRTAQQIIDDPANAALKNLGHQKDIKRDALTQRLGDLDDPDPEKRADAAYNWAGTLNAVKQLKAYDGSDRGNIATNGKVEGITRHGDARHGTEAGVLKDFAETGAFPDNGCLPTTTDTHVRKNGTNKNDFQWGMERLGKFITGALSKVFSVMADVVGKVLGKIPGIGKFLAAPAEIMGKAISDGFAVANVAVGGGDVKAARKEMGLDMLNTTVSSTVGIADASGVLAGQAGQAARDAADPNGTSSPNALKVSLV